MVERLGAVDLEQAQAGRAQVHAVERPVVEPGDAEGAPVADALGRIFHALRPLPFTFQATLTISL